MPSIAPKSTLAVSTMAHAGEIGSLPNIDPSKLTITLSTNLKPLPPPESLRFGAEQTDHMLIMDFDPARGWSAPEIKPYTKLELDPMCSIFHYTPALFEGMKAYVGPDGRARLFRPNLNMKRMASSADRVALPEFNPDALLILIKKLVEVERRWIPTQPGYSLYIRPTYIGTKASLGVAPSSHATLFVVLSPTGPYFPTGFSPVSLYAETDAVRSWPGGTGAFKLGINYAPCFKPQREAARLGYQQIVWILGKGKEKRITEVGQMNFFGVFRREDGDFDVVTPPLDGTILPGVTRASVIQLCTLFSTLPILRQFAKMPRLVSSGTTITEEPEDIELVHPSTKSSPSSPAGALPSTPTGVLGDPASILEFESGSDLNLNINLNLNEPSNGEREGFGPGTLPTLHLHEAQLYLDDFERFAREGRVVEAFGVGTAAVVCPIGRIGVRVDDGDGDSVSVSASFEESDSTSFDESSASAAEEEEASHALTRGYGRPTPLPSSSSSSKAQRTKPKIPKVRDIVLPEYEGGLGPVAGAMYRALVAVQEGRVDVEGWSVTCS